MPDNNNNTNDFQVFDYLENKKEFFHKIDLFTKKKHFETFRRKIQFFPKKIEKDFFSNTNSSTKETNSCLGFPKENFLEIFYKTRMFIHILEKILEINKKIRINYYMNKWKYSSKSIAFQQNFELKMKEKEKIHEEVCKKYQELMLFERENFIQLGEKQKQNKENSKIILNKNPSKEDVVRLFDDYYERLVTNIKASLHSNSIKSDIKNKNILYDLFLDIIDEFSS